MDCTRFTLAADIDPGYDRAYRRARAAGVETLVLATNITTDAITAAGLLPLAADLSGDAHDGLEV